MPGARTYVYMAHGEETPRCAAVLPAAAAGPPQRGGGRPWGVGYPAELASGPRTPRLETS